MDLMIENSWQTQCEIFELSRSGINYLPHMFEDDVRSGENSEEYTVWSQTVLGRKRVPSPTQRSLRLKIYRKERKEILAKVRREFVQNIICCLIFNKDFLVNSWR
jgi:hypothetical protein